VVVDAVQCEPVSKHTSLINRNLQGKLPILVEILEIRTEFRRCFNSLQTISRGIGTGNRNLTTGKAVSVQGTHTGFVSPGSDVLTLSLSNERSIKWLNTRHDGRVTARLSGRPITRSGNAVT
jgi:hypothetical protein